MTQDKLLRSDRGNDGNTVFRKPAPDRSPSVLVAPGLASILIPCCGQLEFTKLCVPSVLRHTRPPFELIFLDIGSLDGTADYLAGVKAAATDVRVEVVRAATDLHIPAAVEDALRQARGEFLVLLNNDTVVPELWLTQLVGVVAMAPEVGLAGPMTNHAYPPQRVGPVPYRVGPKKGARWHGPGAADEPAVNVEAVAAFAREFRHQHTGKWEPVDRLAGFCLLLKREVLKKIEGHTGLREWTDLRLFDTDLLSVKARQLGYRLALCKDLFVHHFGSRVFAHGAPADRDDAKPAGRPGTT